MLAFYHPFAWRVFNVPLKRSARLSHVQKILPILVDVHQIKISLIFKVLMLVSTPSHLI